MKHNEIEVVVYGAELLCPSCVNLPSSKETFEWLGAAIERKYPNQSFLMNYVDIEDPPDHEEKRHFAQRVIEEDMFYPVVTVNDKIVGEGNPRLKTVFAELERLGFTPDQG